MFANTRVSLLLYVSLLLPVASSAEPVPFKRAIELAIRNSTAMSAASADVNRLQALYQESRDQYIPQVYFGSGLAYSFGFPLGEPSIFKVSSTSLLLNYAQREFIKAARSDMRASTANKEEKKGQMILETALSYAELDKNQASINILRQQQMPRDVQPPLRLKDPALNELATDPLSLAEYDGFILRSRKESRDLTAPETEPAQLDLDGSPTGSGNG